MSFRPVTILGCGMMTAVGLTAPASCASIRARLDGFRETRFIGAGGEWIIGAEVPLEDVRHGIPRLARLLAGPIGECLNLCGAIPPAEIPVLLCLAEQDRPGRLDELGPDLFSQACAILGVDFHGASRLIPHGRVGGASALYQASQLIHEHGFRCVIVAGVDTYLVAETLGAFDERNRLLTQANSDGFIPGEAGAAVLVGPGGESMTVLGMGFAVEKSTIASAEPLRGEGLTQAISDALRGADLTMHDLAYRLSDISGEQYGFREAALALARTLRQRKEEFDLWHPADCLGEVGAAALPCMLAVAEAAGRKGYAPGSTFISHLANDDGRRAALVARVKASDG